MYKITLADRTQSLLKAMDQLFSTTAPGVMAWGSWRLRPSVRSGSAINVEEAGNFDMAYAHWEAEAWMNETCALLSRTLWTKHWSLREHPLLLLSVDTYLMYDYSLRISLTHLDHTGDLETDTYSFPYITVETLRQYTSSGEQ